MAESPAIESRNGLTLVQWLVCTMAAIGFTFDIWVLLMAPLVFPPGIKELAGASPTDPATRPMFLMWFGRLFFIPAFAGGIFGLLGGYLTDRLGRRRILTYSILLYAVAAFLGGFVTSMWMLLVLRCFMFIGVSVEFVAAVAWLAELFPDPKRREKVLGYTQAFSSLGGILVAVTYRLAVQWSPHLPALQVPGLLHSVMGSIDPINQHQPWRYTMIAGLIPTIPLIVIRPFLPESPAWQAKKEAGTLKRPSLGELFAPRLRRTTVITTIMFACSYGAAFGAIQQMPHILPGNPQVKAMSDQVAQKIIEANSKAENPKPEAELKKQIIPAQKQAVQAEVADVAQVQEIGGLIGRVLLAVLAVVIISRRKLIRVFLIPGVFIMPLVFGYAAINSLNLLYVGMFMAGLLTVGQFSYWGNYLPRVYPMHLRGTGESFAANVGGRMIGTSAALLTTSLVASMPGATAPTRLAYAAAVVGTAAYVIGFIASFWLPEPKQEQLPE
jgi:MFS family permease